jgi:D-alanyl-D-alanine carboxypeptidase
MMISRVCIQIILLIPLIAACRGEAGDTGIYGSVPAARYLTGRFVPAKHELFTCINDLGVPTAAGRHYLRREAAQALKEMYRDFRKAHPKEPFWVQSSTRSFDDQKYIWEGKWTGRVEVMGKRLDIAFRNPLARAREILRYSSMPGTSRHHWGTDFDLNVLVNGYYESGAGKELYRWLLANAGRYGFCQPYTAGRRDGYSEEKWHWSYAPLARKFLAGWNGMLKDDPAAFTAPGLFLGSKEAGSLAAEYANSIGSGCR